MMDRFYDKQGKAISLGAWGKLFEDHEYKAIRKSYTPEGTYWVSTVWLGIEHGYKEDKPLIFESMVFGTGTNASESFDQVRYTGIQDAIKGHNKLLIKYTKIEKRGLQT